MLFTTLLVLHVIAAISSLAYIAGSLKQNDQLQQRVSLHSLTTSLISGTVLAVISDTTAHSVLLHAILYLVPYSLLFFISVRKSSLRINTLEYAMPAISFFGLFLLNFSAL